MLSFGCLKNRGSLVELRVTALGAALALAVHSSTAAPRACGGGGVVTATKGGLPDARSPVSWPFCNWWQWQSIRRLPGST